MPKQKIKAIVNRFLKGNDPNEVKKSIEKIYGRAMLSKDEISPEERHEFTYDCREIINFFSELSIVDKKRLKKAKKKTLSSTS